MQEYNKKLIAQRMREAREFRGLTLYEMTEKMDVTFDRLKALEATGDDVDLPYIIRLAKELNVPIESFFDNREDFSFSQKPGSTNITSKMTF